MAVGWFLADPLPSPTLPAAPQQRISWRLMTGTRAQACTIPADAVMAWETELTCVGEDWLVLLPMPSCALPGKPIDPSASSP